MLKPEPGDWRKAERLGRYLEDNMKVVLECQFQKVPDNVVVWSDTDFAGWKRI